MRGPLKRLTVMGAALALMAAAPADLVLGEWLTQDRDGVIRIQGCERGLCGSVVGLTGFKPDGTPPRDVNGQTQCGLPIITDAMRSGSGVWFGHIRNPEDGRVHDIELSVDAQGRLHMRGYVGVPLLGKTVVWTRYHGRLTQDCFMS